MEFYKQIFMKFSHDYRSFVLISLSFYAFVKIEAKNNIQAICYCN